MRRPLKLSLWGLGGTALFVLILIVIILSVGNTDVGRSAIERLTYRLSGGYVTLSGLRGRFPSHLTLDRLVLTDSRGVWLSAESITLDWSPWSYLTQGLSVEDVHAVNVSMQRLPQGSSESSQGEPFMPRVEVAHFGVDTVKLGAELAGAPATLTLKGSAHMRSVSKMLFDVDARRVDGDGEYSLHLNFDSKRMDATLNLHEPANGPLENILSVPGLGDLHAQASFAGPRTDERLSLLLQAGGLKGQAQGSLNLSDLSADLNFDFDATAMQPRADFSWSHLALRGSWHGSLTALNANAQLNGADLTIPGGVQMAQLNVDFKAVQGAAGMRALIERLKIPGSAPLLFADSPIKLDASMRFDEAAWPLELTASHRLFAVHLHANAAGQQSAQGEVKLLDLSPFAALAHQNIDGSASVTLQMVNGGSALRVTANAVAQLKNLAEIWADAVGERAVMQASGSVSRNSVDVDNFKLTGRSLSATLSGSYAISEPSVRARFALDLDDLQTLSTALTGRARASGSVQGPIDALAGEADASAALSVHGSPSGNIRAQAKFAGLPSAPTGSLAVDGDLDGSPLHALLDAQRDASGGLHSVLRAMQWKSAHAEGDFTTSMAHQTSQGQLRATIAQLSDLQHLLGINLAGQLGASVDLIPDHDRTRLHVDLIGNDLLFASLSGSMHVSGDGFSDAFPFQIDAEVPKLRGAAASLQAAGALNWDRREVTLSHAQAHYHGQEIDLKAPARVMFGNGIAVDLLKLGAQQAELEIQGPIWPDAALRIALRKVQPQLVNVFVPELLAAGSIEAHAEVHGDLQRPTGQMELNAIGLRSADDVALGLPAANLRANVMLLGNTADLDVQLNAGAGSQLSVTGRVPLALDGAVDAKVNGKVSVGIINPLLEARGQHADGTLEIDAAVQGSVADPQIGGTAHLSQADLRDYGRGVSITNIDAQLEGAAGAIQIKSLTANAAPGTIKVTGSFGVLQPKMPIDLKFTAENAQPIVSKLITANLNANLQVSGNLKEQVSITGSLNLNRTLIGIPNSLPPNVAVLDVRRRGKAAPPAPVKPLVVTLDVGVQAPRQILVQGRGLDAEMGGELHITGTSESPLVSGDFGLLRGSFSLAGSKLTFTPDSNISFNGAGLQNRLDPTLDFTATSAVSSSAGDAAVSLRITGLADAPQFEFTSTPALPQDEIMALLLFGTPANALSPLQLAQVGVALASLSGVGGDSPLVKIQRSLGLDRLSFGAGATTTTGVGTTENTGASIQAGRYISKRVYIEGRQSTTGTSQLEADIDLTKRLKLQTKLGNGTASVQGTTPDNDPGSSIGLIYQFEY